MAAGGSAESSGKVRLLSGEGNMIEVSMDVVSVSRTLSTMINGKEVLTVHVDSFVP